MEKETKGVIYILTNPSFPDYVKIGYADDVEKRVKELNRSECTPFAFRIYATYKVSERLTDMKLHNIIDKLNPDLRSIDNVDGKKRVREFYAITKEDAYAIFEAIAEINSLKDNLKFWEQSPKEKEEEEIAQTISNDKQTYTEEDHFNKSTDDITKLYINVRNSIVNRFHLEVEPKKVYIAFKNQNSNICDIELFKSKLLIWINMPKGTLKDPKEYTRDVSNIGHHGNGDYSLTISSENEIDDLMELVKQSCNYNK